MVHSDVLDSVSCDMPSSSSKHQRHFHFHFFRTTTFSSSTAYDSNIFEDTRHEHPQFDWEMNIGDGHFATCPNFFTPVQKQPGRLLTAQETTWNEWIQLPRSRIEHINSVVKNHCMFKGEPFRGWVRNFRVFVNISVHGSAAELRARGNRYAGFGPWAH